VLKTAAKTALILVVLDLLRLSKNASWFEVRKSVEARHLQLFLTPCAAQQEHVDFVSMQAVLFNGAARSWWAQTATLVRLQSRLVD